MIDRPGTSLVQQPLQPMTIPGHVVAPTQAVPADQMSRMVHAAVNTVNKVRPTFFFKHFGSFVGTLLAQKLQTLAFEIQDLHFYRWQFIQ